ncbi:MAG: tRNA pseudouridine(38-40) synthase TruA [Eubacteriales bacterium]|nr:tRNA pseudouridine(38-40) synthase TruA [Eubacteriales bacterium]
MITALVISYKGTGYCGWQVQAQSPRPSVQKTLQTAIETVIGCGIKLSGCSRTDSGVHANEYYCHLDRYVEIDCDRLPLAINKYLPDDICVKRAFTAEDSFHSRYFAKGKEYMYLVWNSRLKNVFYTDTAYMYPKRIDVDVINAFGKGFEGTHDFTSFMSAHSKIKDTVRTVWYFRAERDGDFVRFYTAADGFLYNMVRIMVGSALEICSGRITLPIEEIIERKSRQAAGKTMPAQGLYLNKVIY